MSIQINCSQRRNNSYNRRNTRRNTMQLSAFIKADNKQVDSEGFVTVRRNNKRRPKKTFMNKVKTNPNVNHNRFTALDNQSEKNIVMVNGPKVVKPKAPMGAWGKKPVKKVTFAKDNVDTLMKPDATMVKLFNKTDSPKTISEKVQKYPDEEEYLKLKRSNNAWKPKVRSTPTSVTITNDWALKKLIEKQKKAPIINWADAVSSDEEDSEDDEEEILLDSHGRPQSDNSAW